MKKDYNILDLQNMSLERLAEIAIYWDITINEMGKQDLMYAILAKQAKAANAKRIKSYSQINTVVK